VRPVICALLIVLVFSAGIHAGTIGKWKSYTSKKEVRDVVVANDKAWAVTSGGLFAYHFSDGSIEQFTTSEGLHSIDLTAIAADSAGTFWIGASNGLLHSYKPGFQSWNYFTGISSLSNEPKKQINGLTISGDTLFVLSEIGLSIFSTSKLEFGDTYRRFGTGVSQLTGNVVAVERFHNALWIATTTGIAYTSETNSNPSEPGSWQVMNSELPSLTVRDLVVYHDTLFAATASGLAFYTGTSWQVMTQTSGRDVTTLSTNFGIGISSVPASLFFTVGTELWRYGNDFIGAVATGFPSSLTSLTSYAVIGSVNNGILFDSSPLNQPVGTNWHTIVPPGPSVNGLVGITVDDKGVFWAGTGTTGAGFTSFDGTTWKVFTPETTPELLDARYAYIINVGADNSKWISMFGQGVVHLNSNDEIEAIYNTTNGLSYTKNDPDNHNFVAVSGVVTDKKGDVWINVRGAVDRNLLAVLSHSTNTFTYKSYPSGKLPNSTKMIIDDYGTKWFTSISISQNDVSPGLVFYDDTKRLPRRIESGSGWGLITEDQDGLTNNEVTALAIDLDGSLWVGTSEGGLNIIVDPTVPYRILQYHPLEGVKINDILVDPLNQKWVATEQGVFLLSPDGTSVLDSLTVKTTDGKLPHDHVESLGMNRQTGTIFFGTEGGLATLTTAGVTPRSSFGELKIFPNPLLLPSSAELTVDGLVEGSTIKILSSSGNLIKEILTPGGRVGFWDGTDSQGEMVGSGIYIVTAYSKDGKAVGTGKVAVVRK